MRPACPLSRSGQDAREGPALASRGPGILSQLGAGALHGTHFTTYNWEYNYKLRTSANEGASQFLCNLDFSLSPLERGAGIQKFRD
jgi:hypothetical protein